MTFALKIRTFASLIAAATWTAAATAHPGPRVWLDASSGKIATWAGPYPATGNATDYSPSRVFTQDMGTSLDDDGVDWQTDFPGFQVLTGGTVAPGTTFSFNIAGAVQWFDGNRFLPVSQAFANPTPVFAITNELGQTRYSGAGFVEGDAAFTFGGSPSDHGHLTYTLLGDGTNVDGPAGVYAIPLQVAAPGLETSDTYYLLLGHQASGQAIADAAKVAGVQLVPEPGGACVLLIGAVVGLRRSRRGVKTAAVLAALAVPAAAFAHGPVIQVTIDNGKLVTRRLILDDPYDTLQAKTRIFQIPLVQRSLGDANDGWYGQVNTNNPNAALLGPGIAYGLGGFSSGVSIREGFADGLKRWDGTALVDPGATQLQGLRGNIAAPSTTFVSTDAGPFGGFSINTPATITAASHNQVYWRLLGDGTTSNSASSDGVYVATLQLSTSQAGVAASDPFYVLFFKNASQEQIDAATAYVSTMVPEPSTALPAAGLMLLAGRRRRR